MAIPLQPLSFEYFLEKLDDWGMTVTEDMDPAQAGKYVFKRFCWLSEVLQQLYFVATKAGKVTTLEDANKRLKEHERVDALLVAAKRWRAVKLQHDGKEICLRECRDFRRQYVLFRRNMAHWNEGDEQSRLFNLLPDAWVKRVTKEEARRAKSSHTMKSILNR